jgi:MinD-like ATPase involved in chromosome partitioning or flagellar assembly
MGQIVSVHSSRGSTGKSNLTANLAATTASQGKRVGIVDTDIQSPGIHVLFGEEMLRLGSAGVFCLQYPEHPFTDAIRQVAGQILG